MLKPFPSKSHKLGKALNISIDLKNAACDRKKKCGQKCVVAFRIYELFKVLLVVIGVKRVRIVTSNGLTHYYTLSEATHKAVKHFDETGEWTLKTVVLFPVSETELAKNRESSRKNFAKRTAISPLKPITQDLTKGVDQERPERKRKNMDRQLSFKNYELEVHRLGKLKKVA